MEESAGFFLVERVDDGFVAHLEPWWPSTNEERKAFHEDHPNPVKQPPKGHIKQHAPPTRPYGVILKVANETNHFEIPPDRCYEFGLPSSEIEWILDELDMECLHLIFRPYCDDWAAIDGVSYSTPSGVQIGPQRLGNAGEQMSLGTAVAVDD